jgi:hypothetical protein
MTKIDDFTNMTAHITLVSLTIFAKVYISNEKVNLNLQIPGKTQPTLHGKKSNACTLFDVLLQ